MPGRRIRVAIVVADIVLFPLVLFLAYLLRYGDQVFAGLGRPAPWAQAILLLAGLSTWLGLSKFVSLDGFRDGWHLRASASRVILATSIQMCVILSLAYATQLYYSRLVLAYFAILFCGSVLSVRIFTYHILRKRHRAGRIRRVVLIGDGRVAGELRRRIEQHPELLYEVVGLLNPTMQPDNGRQEQDVEQAEDLSSLDVLSLLEQNNVAELMVCLDEPISTELRNFLAHCRERRISVNLVPQPYELYSSRAKLLEIGGVPLIFLDGPPDFRAAAAFKRAADLVLCVPLGAFALPILTVSCLILKFQGRKLLYRELRCGQSGKPFWMYRLDVDRRDTGATPFQRFLCRISISELPQLFNVLLGQMSLVGPRPEPPERVRDYSDWQRQRLKVRPGMTGLAQVNGLREQHSSEEKTRYDLQYVVRWTPVTDLVLLFETAWTLVARWGDRGEPHLAPSSNVDNSSSLITRSAPE